MKIKEVCQQTGLTDRTVRYYIECGLLTPNNRESYTGRRSFHFTTADVERLEAIKVLRGAGFSVEQIKSLQSDRSSREVIQKRLRELEDAREHDRQLYDCLKKADLAREVSAEELVIILKSPNPTCEAPAVEETAPLHKLLSKAKIAITALSVGFLAFAVLMTAVFFFMGGPDWLANRNLNGTAILTVSENGDWLLAEEYSLSGMAGVRNITRGENGYSFALDYGETRAAICVEELVIECGFVNINNWHHPHIRVDIEHTDNGTLVTQTVTYKTDHDRVETLKNTAYAVDGQVSVFMHGVPSSDTEGPAYVMFQYDGVYYGMAPDELVAIKGEPREIDDDMSVAPELTYYYTESVHGYEADVCYTFWESLFQKELISVDMTIPIEDPVAAREVFDGIYNSMTAYYETLRYNYNDGVVIENDRHFYAALGTNDGATGISVWLEYESGVLTLCANEQT